MTTEKRNFRLDNHAISMLIQAQAGSLQKAILEAVANALDAGASKVKVSLTADRVVIEDDGRGFQGEEELEKFFETFGFDHSQLDRKVGRFGVGRGQLFHFGKNLWTTHGYTMSVDTKSDMFGYELGRAKKPHKGVKIEIDLYSPLQFSELSTVESELKKLVRFSTIPVILNGKPAQKNPQDMKWDAETDEAWFMLDDSYELKVYSQGLFVQGLSSRQFGKGGLVVTKLGQPLKQNMARNDMLITDCEIWAKVSAKLKELGRTLQKKARTGPTMNESMRATMATDAVNSNDISGLENLYGAALFTLTNGRHVRLPALLSTGFVARAPNKDPAADLLLQRKQAHIINPQTLHRFQVENVAELREKLVAAVSRYDTMTASNHYQQHLWNAQQQVKEVKKLLATCVFEEKVQDLPMNAEISLVEVKDREASVEERLALSIVRKDMMPALTASVWNELHPEGPVAHQWGTPIRPLRRVQLAVSEGSHACTDGHTKIWIDRKFLAECIAGGPRGFTRLANIITHELIHDVDSSTGHDHDIDFYQAFHELTVDGDVGNLGLAAYRKWLRRGGKATMYSIKDMEGAGLLEPDDVNARQASLANPEVLAEELDKEMELVGMEEAAPPRPRRLKR